MELTWECNILGTMNRDVETIEYIWYQVLDQK